MRLFTAISLQLMPIAGREKLRGCRNANTTAGPDPERNGFPPECQNQLETESVELTSNPGGNDDAPAHKCDAGFSPLNRRIDFTACLLAGSTGLVAATGLAVRSALAQGTPTPGMPAVQAPIRQDWLDENAIEEIIEPDLPIVDPHHHLWDRPGYRYLFHDLLADIGSGHNIRATLFEECGAMYRVGGPEELRSLGETEFVTGVAGDERLGQIRADTVLRWHHRKC